MPQGLGKNLYFELSVFENIDFFARLFGVPDAEREPRIKGLLNATGLGPFPDRPAGKLSGGMKQKVGLCGALIHDPDLLILDEPTTGVDPLSRQQFWNLIDHIREQRPGMSVLVSTAYMDEAQRFDWTIAMDAGRVIATGTPAQLMERTGTSNLEEAFVALLPGAEEGGAAPGDPPARGPRRRAGHPGHGSHQAIRQLHRRQSREFHHRPRRDLRLPRLQRLRQVHDDEDAHRPATRDRGRGQAVRRARGRRRSGDSQARGLHVAGILALWRAFGAAEPRPPRQDLRLAPRPGQRPDR